MASLPRAVCVEPSARLFGFKKRHSQHEPQRQLLGNAMMESFFGRFKTEHMFWEKYATYEEVRRKIFEWIEIEYNRKRAHTALGNVSPIQFEEDKVAKAAY